MKTWILKHLTEIFMAFIAILLPLMGIMIAIGCLILFDFITGVSASFKRKEKITSRKMSVTIGKFTYYNIALFTGVAFQFLWNHLFNTRDDTIIKLISIFIGITETKSVFENINSILGINFWTLIKGYLMRNQGLTKDLIGAPLILPNDKKDPTPHQDKLDEY